MSILSSLPKLKILSCLKGKKTQSSSKEEENDYKNAIKKVNSMMQQRTNNAYCYRYLDEDKYAWYFGTMDPFKLMYSAL